MVVLAHHKVKDQRKRDLPLDVGQPGRLKALTEPGSGEIQENENMRLAEIIEKVNTRCEGELADDDKLFYVSCVEGQAAGISYPCSTGRKQHQGAVFHPPPDLSRVLMNSIFEAFAAYGTMNK